MAVNPVDTGFQALYGLLSGDTTFMGYLSGGLWAVSAPIGTPYEFGLLVCQSAGPDTLSAMGGRIMTRLLYQVKIYGTEQAAANCRAAFARADALLQPSGQPLRNSSGVMAIYRESMLPTDGGVVNGVQYYAAGGLYRVEVA